MMDTSIFRAILWKYYVIRKRHYILTLLEILGPILLVGSMTYFRSCIPGFTKIYVNEVTNVPSFTDFNLKTSLTISEIKVYYAPSTEFTDELVRRVQLKLNIYNEDIMGFKNELELFNYYNKNATDGTNVAIVFKVLENSTPKQLEYDMKIYKDSVLWQTKHLFSENPFYTPGIGSKNYISESFMPIQFALDVSFIEIVSNRNLDVEFRFQEFPYPPHISDVGMNSAFFNSLPFITVISFLFVCSSILKNVVQEKQSGIKELMKINGLKTSALWFGWFMNGFLVNLLSVIVIVVLLKCKFWDVEYPPIEHCNWLVLGLLLTLYCSATISFMLAFSTLFKKATWAMVVGLCVLFSGFIAFITVLQSVPLMSCGLKYLFMLMPNAALYFGYNVISVFELNQLNLSMWNLQELPTGNADDLSMFKVLVFLFGETLGYFFLALYLDAVFPGTFGIPKRWNYFIPGHCFGRSNSISQDNLDFGNSETIEKLDVSESDVIIRLRDLTKTYKNTLAVNKLNMDIYKGTVTGLLGHNGAGKTTTMSMITGITKPTSGEVYIDGVPITKDPDLARKKVAVCPQHNLLFNELTVYQHLVFFGLLRGLKWTECRKAVEILLADKLKLAEKRDTYVDQLSGGMKRKLALGLALIGNTEVLILDEPTAGIDIEGRREIWNLILSYRLKKTILISTHFIEEADELSDRIAIMDSGKLVCYGSSIFLRNIFNMGYICTISFKGMDTNKILNFVKEELADEDEENLTTLKSHSLNTLQICLPNDKKHRFSNLFQRMHEKRQDLCIENFSMSNTTLEDVVLKVMSTIQSNECEIDPRVQSRGGGSTMSEQTNAQPPSVRHLFWSLIKKHLNFSMKIWRYYMFMMAVFFIFAFVTLYWNKLGYESVSRDGTKLALTLRSYGGTNVYYSLKGTNDEKLKNVYREVITSEGSTSMPVDNVTTALIDVGINNLVQFKKRLVIASEFEVQDGDLKTVEVFYSNNALHGAPISLNVATNTLLKYVMNDSYSISTSNTPLHSFKKSYAKVQQSETANVLLWILFLPLGPLFLSSTVLSFATYMHVHQITVLQRLCGITPVLYWIKNFFTDYIFYTISTLLLHVILTILIYLNVLVMDATLSLYLWGILSLYGFVNIPFAYLFTRMKSLESAILRFLTISMVLGVTLAATLMFAELFETIQGRRLWLVKTSVLLVPQASLTYMLGKFATKVVQLHNWDIRTSAEMRYMCYENPQPCCDQTSVECAAWRNPFAYDVDLIFGQIFIGILYLVIVILLECDMGFEYLKRSLGSIGQRKGNTKTDTPKPIKPNTEEVQLKDTRADETDSSNHFYNVKSLSKWYLQWTRSPRKFFINISRPVDNLSFTVRKNECFGLLGVNGAGKTTTFRLLTHSLQSTKGEIEEPDKCTMGYCPQADALIDYFTPTELLMMFAEFRDQNAKDEDVEQLVNALGLGKYKDVPCGKLSGGNKRKLNTAIALSMCPKLILLDEPTNGVDPISRRELWSVIIQLKNKENHSSRVILTSHSMDECEALCDRMSIMKKGKIVGQGTVSALKEEYCVGHIVKVQFVDNDALRDHADSVLNYVRTELVDYKVLEIERVGSVLRLRVKNEKKTQTKSKQNSNETMWGKIFDCMEKVKGYESIKNKIIDYLVRETSFEEVFLNIANSENFTEPVSC